MVKEVEWLFVALIAAVLWFGGDHFGHTRGVNEQKVADQVVIDKINRDLAQQKVDAAELLRQANAGNAQLTAERDRLKLQIGQQREKDRIGTDDARRKFSDRSLRIPAPEGGTRGQGGDGPAGTGPAAPGAAGSATVQLPSTVTVNLRQLAFEADTLADNYRACKAFVELVVPLLPKQPAQGNDVAH